MTKSYEDYKLEAEAEERKYKEYEARMSEYSVKIEKVDNTGFGKNRIDIFKNDQKIGEYFRNYDTFYNTFVPFEQNGKQYALYSSHYTATRIMELPSCKDIGGENPSASGFCPVDFHVPKEGDGTFGFVAGCIWGDDSSWKIETLDLSKINEGILIRNTNLLGYAEKPYGRSLKEVINTEYLDEGWFEVDLLHRVSLRNKDTVFDLVKNWLPFGDDTVKMFKHLEKFCTKCGYLKNKRTNPIYKKDENGKYILQSMEIVENDPYFCKCLKVNDNVIKDSINWIPSDFDKWGAGEGVGKILEIVDEKTVDVQWDNGRAYQLNKELIRVENENRDLLK
jgi:hypothetical protein